MTQFVATFHPRFARHAGAEIVAADETAVVGRLDLGVGRVETRTPPVDPVFVEHLAPVHVVATVDGTWDDVNAIAKAVVADGAAHGHSSLAVECRRGPDAVSGRHHAAAYTTRDVEIATGTLLATEGATIDLSSPAAVVHVYLTGRQALIGVQPTSKGQRIYANAVRHAPATRVSRAEHKLHEAIDVFHMTLRTGGRVLDLGAAPGGWSLLLADRGLRVTAVDPAALDPAVAAHPAVEHLRQRAETIDLTGRRFDLVVNDMAVDPDDSAAILARIAPHARPAAPAVMTVKLPTRNVDRWVRAARAALQKEWSVVAARHLAANRQELTWLLERATA